MASKLLAMASNLRALSTLCGKSQLPLVSASASRRLVSSRWPRKFSPARQLTGRVDCPIPVDWEQEKATKDYNVDVSFLTKTMVNKVAAGFSTGCEKHLSSLMF